MNNVSIAGKKRNELNDICIDFKNYMSNLYDCEIPITRTFFNNKILRISKEMMNNFDISTEDIDGLIKFSDDEYERYKGFYAASINVRDRNYYDGYVQAESTNKYCEDSIIDICEFEKGAVERGSVDYFGTLGKLQRSLEIIFKATRFACRMSDNNKY